MSTIRLHRTTTTTPEQYVAGLTDFGPGRWKLFGNSADEYLKGAPEGPVGGRRKVQAASGNCTTTGLIPTGWSSRRPTSMCGEERRVTPTLSRGVQTARLTLIWSWCATARILKDGSSALYCGRSVGVFWQMRSTTQSRRSRLETVPRGVLNWSARLIVRPSD